MPKVTIIFPTYNGWKDTKECLKSLSHLSYPKNLLEIFVVDNNSKDGTPQNIKKFFPKVKLIRNSKNLGYSKAVNIAYKKSHGKYILFSNNDIILDKNYIENMTELFQTDEKIGIIGAKVYKIDQKKKLAFDGLRVNPYLGFHQYDLTGLNNVREIDIPPAGGFIVRRKMLDNIGPLDNGYFLYFEDLDICLRAKKHGYKVMFNPKAIAYHGFGKTAFKQKFEEIVYQGYKSKFRCLFKNATLPQIISSLIAQFTVLIFAQNLKSEMKTYKPMLKGLLWNLKHFRETFDARRKTLTYQLR